ncbi:MULTISPECIES: hypothetical protein [Stappia]|uniref:Histidine kinase n=1 Tax=Stappia taiwanensis TaxID=992267 RepID=A0A838XXN5_9HYPH|nr:MULTISPECIES: hypothetical protein [Stappia]MBA4611550.1 hypothetical protein [Stappia taiwanensis]MCA1300270.1 hypothetical protein [Stappia indica]GGE99363.1 hypothetical protein GCM10007285_28750 [Stappia taiwanensis]
MPTLSRLLFVLVLLGGLAVAAVYGLATFVEPSQRDITVRVQMDGFGR